ncbi:hypothetical protein [uncultured Formosa sp.]|uniref:hypothetical protein n=1 Tax=uncultured Formosa sp. TaxID=255435 RepID=UPI00262E761A|nr:hypothetical protein [uncultured Formosa sp.]
MKNIILFFTVFILGVSQSHAQKEKITGNWLITKVEVKDRIINPYQTINYSQDGKMIIMGIEAGIWEYNKENHSIVTKSELDKDFNGENKILKLSDTALVVLKDGAKVFYNKINFNQVSKENANAGLMGSWRLNNEENPDTVHLLTFTSPDNFVLITKDYGSQSKSKGTWIFNKKDKTVILIGLSMEQFKGLNNIIHRSENQMSLENKGITYEFTKEKNQTNTIEHLAFSQDDFFNENGDFKYEEDENKLPWKNWNDMKLGILNVKQLIYTYSSLIPSTTAFENKTLTANVEASMNEEAYYIDNVFIGFDSYNVPENAQFPINSFNDYNKLYPLEDATFRIQGENTITTPAGTFNCTIVEALNGDVKQKLWMINDKLGVYAKIIEEDPDTNFGHYYIYELQEIINNN